MTDSRCLEHYLHPFKGCKVCFPETFCTNCGETIPAGKRYCSDLCAREEDGHIPTEADNES